MSSSRDSQVLSRHDKNNDKEYSFGEFKVCA